MEALSESMISVNPSDRGQELMERLDILRRNQGFCDVKLVVKDKELPAHKAVLAAASPFFLSHLTRDKGESIKIELKEATVSVMEDVLQYIYTGNVLVTEENAHNLLATADFLLLSGLKTTVDRYLITILTIENCVFSYYFAEKYYCVDLKEKACEMIKSNFSAVMETEEFLSLECFEVAEWVSSDDITIVAEEEVFKGIVKWVSHNRSEREVEFPFLLRLVRLVSISSDFLLNKLVKENLVRTNNECLNYVLDCMGSSSSTTDDLLVQPPRECLKLCVKAIFVCGGRRALCYLPEQNEWYMLSSNPFQHEQCSNPSQYGDLIYMSSQNLDVLDAPHLMEFYAPATNCWGAFQVESSSFTNTVVLRECMYATAEAWDSNEICRFDPENVCFNDLKKPPNNLFDRCVVTDAVKYIYLIGGASDCYGSTSLSTYRFDPSADDHEWEEVAPINQARRNAFGAVMNGKVYIAGGCQGQEALSTCEVYNPETNEWQLMPSLKAPRMSASMVCHDGRLYVLGGVIPSNGRLSRVLSIETFDSEQNEWRERSVIPVNSFETSDEEKQLRYMFKACSASLPKEVIVKLSLLHRG